MGPPLNMWSMVDRNTRHCTTVKTKTGGRLKQKPANWKGKPPAQNLMDLVFLPSSFSTNLTENLKKENYYTDHRKIKINTSQTNTNMFNLNCNSKLQIY